MHSLLRRWCALLLLLAGLAPAARAATVAFTPQGEVAQVRQIRAVFSEPMMALGDPEAPAPFEVQCAEPGAGRWLDAKTWVYEMQRDAPPGLRCGFTLKTGIKTQAGARITGTARFAFSTGGPAVVRIEPYEGNEAIDEEQVFVLTLSGPATEESVTRNAYCVVAGVADRVPVALVGGENRRAILQATLGRRRPWLGGDLDRAAQDAARKAYEARTLTLQCRQRLPAGTDVTLVLGPGIATATGVTTSTAQRFRYKTRAPFTASLSCERENAQSPCLPIRPVRVVFTSPVTRTMAQAVRLKVGDAMRKPSFEQGERSDALTEVRFAPPFPERAELAIELPARFVDDSGRTLANAGLFPLKTRTGEAPPLAKFASSRFGILELNAEPALPITLRKVEAELGAVPGAADRGTVTSLAVQEPAAILQWLQRLRAFARTDGPGEEDSRARSLLAGEGGTRRLALPAPPRTEDGSWPFEVVGLPMRTPGLHVVELQSQRLGASLLANRAPMFVRTAVLVTNLAVHFKWGRENAAVWVTTLDRARPVEGAEVTLMNCRAEVIWRGSTSAQGVAYIPQRLDDGPCHVSPYGDGPAFAVFARKIDTQGRRDLAFVLSDWNDGIESWRFNLPQEMSRESTLRAHTVFDRTLFRAGETVSMKHLVRRETLRGFELLPPDALPRTVRIKHLGSEQEYTLPLAWATPRWAAMQWKIPEGAKLGRYDVILETQTPLGPQQVVSGQFRVEQFRLPVLTGRILPPKDSAVAPTELPIELQMEYVSGGPASGLPMRVTGMTRRRWIAFPDYEAFAFNFYDEAEEARQAEGQGEGQDEGDRRIVADKLALTLDRAGSGTLTLRGLPRVTRPMDLVLEASFADPNGEVQTLAQTVPLWPAGVMVGIKVDGWTSVQKKVAAQVVVLGIDGKPAADRNVEVRARARDVISHRKRLVGGFYAYDNRRESRELGTVCRGRSDARGLVLCDIALDAPGNIELVAQAEDGGGRTAQALASVWVTQRDELWFEGENQDRMDVLPEKKLYQPGETARFQVRMPFREATALVAVEREGIVQTQVVHLSGRDPTVSVRIEPGFAPNAYVSVLAVRERLREVPWYSLFQWGWHSPRQWWQAFKEWRAVGRPTPLVDLGKPAFKLGIAEIRVGAGAHRLQVQVTPDRTSYPIRAHAKVRVAVKTPDGKPVPAGTQVAFAAVDQALLELQPNTSWNLLEAMLQRRPYGVETFTAQMQVVGKRHFGRKAVPAGGGGGRAPTRELLDTLLLWQPAVALDAHGMATLDVPLNDAITSFRLVAVADAGAGLFGTGAATIRATQDVQVIPGLPPVVRDGDVFVAGFTVRNNGARALTLDVRAEAAGIAPLPTQKLALAAGEAGTASWTVTAPAAEASGGRLIWTVSAEAPGARDAVKVDQRLVPAVPLTVQQATLTRVEKTLTLPVAPPAEALPARSALALGLQASLAEPLPGVQRFFEQYPFVCLEQKVSKAIGLRDAALWKQVSAELPLYLDADGLALYFPPRERDARRGSDVLTAYLLAASHEAGLALPEAARARMESGLIAFVEGRIERRIWAPQRDLDVRKLAAIEALSRSGKAAPRMLDGIAIDPHRWPTSALIDWIAILKRLPAVPGHDPKLAEAEQILRARLDMQGTRLGFSTEKTDDWWWLMVSGDANAARLLLATLDDPHWKEDAPRLLTGLLQRMRNGSWATTTANLWGSLAVEKFARRFEREKVSGRTRVGLDERHARVVEWKADTQAVRERLPLAAPVALTATHEGAGAPWLTVQSLAALPLKAPFSAGFRVTKTVTPVEQKEKGAYSRGDILRVRLEVDAQADMSWVVVSDPIPGGATLLGSGLGRDSQIATAGEKKSGGWDTWLAFEERTQEAYRAYYEFVGKGRFATEYTVRLNNLGEFALPPTRVEAMYAPEMFGESPNARMVIKP